MDWIQEYKFNTNTGTCLRKSHACVIFYTGKCLINNRQTKINRRAKQNKMENTLGGK